MIIKKLTAIEKRVEDISEIFNKEIFKNNQSEMKKKKTPNAISNTLDRINSRLEEAEEWIDDLRDRIIESNQTEPMRGKKNHAKWE